MFLIGCLITLMCGIISGFCFGWSMCERKYEKFRVYEETINKLLLQEKVPEEEQGVIKGLEDPKIQAQIARAYVMSSGDALVITLLNDRVQELQKQLDEMKRGKE